MVQTMLSSAPVVVFSKTYCPYCKIAKDALQKAVTDEYVKVYELDTMSEGSSIQAQLPALSGIKTVPQVFLNKEFIGDGSTIAAMYKTGELTEKLRKAGLLN
ncbi:glutaredoxin [Gregarina niphandrodes]|uniref:Glutaredoxin n=1 Tax=Gregarina niphandrodes TaxID=110365 RepID=A0A023AZI2_GRENI|nr:glutaredoxin [Gregarina niphandrodes]EZG43894.1 glutaredoxin [Gregarina niphandrodes]|eukprot:XP_011132937.1 glutaredoxin [Gregarina niphandrodes]